jgi:hypothetical protein
MAYITDGTNILDDDSGNRLTTDIAVSVVSPLLWLRLHHIIVWLMLTALGASIPWVT